MADNGTRTERYRLIEPVAAGGMGTVWRGRDTLLDREVAIKVIALPDGLGGAERAEVYARAVREARAVARIRHPNVVPVHDVVVRNDGQPPWIIMEFVRGRPMDAVIRQDGPLSPERVADLGAQVLAGLAAGHAEGVLHRDLKPANVMITSEGRALVTDFGIAKLVGEPQWTQPGQVRGTPEYMPPERAWGEEGTPASDLFALGATMFAAFRGQGPFHRDGVDAALNAARHDDPPRVPEAGPLADLIHAMLSRDPAQRPTAAQAAHALDAVTKGAPAPVIPSAGRFPPGMASGGMASASTELSGWTSADMALAGGMPNAENCEVSVVNEQDLDGDSSVQPATGQQAISGKPGLIVTSEIEVDQIEEDAKVVGIEIGADADSISGVYISEERVGSVKGKGKLTGVQIGTSN